MSRTSYYLYAKENTYNSDKKYHRAKHEIRKEFLENMKRYGSRRIKVAIIAEKGIELSCKTVAKLMQKQGSKAIQPKSFVPKPPIALMEKESLKTCFQIKKGILHLGLTNQAKFG